MVRGTRRETTVNVAPLSDDTMKKIHALYEQQIKPLVHHYW